MEQPDEHETSPFSDGLAQSYEDGLPVRSRPAPNRSDDSGATHNAPPDGLTIEALQRFQELVRQERSISAQRRRLHDRIAFVRAQGDAGNAQTASQLDYLLEKERQLSRQRKELHRLIDEM